MSDHQPEAVATPAQPERQGAKTRQVSTIGFPYADIETGLEVIGAMHRAGYRECAPDQLAAVLGQQPSSGNFRLKVTAARTFGLVETSPGRVVITDLGYRALDPAQEKKARADAFLNVPLYRTLYEEYRGKQLPPRPAALERTFERYGVAPKQTDKARHAFERAAKQAGFFNHGNDKLVYPGGLDKPSEPTAPSPPPLSTDAPVSAHSGGNGGGGGTQPPTIDPLIEALLRKMPKGGAWPLVERARWLRTLAMNLSFVYEAGDDDTGEIVVSIKADSLREQ